MAAAARRLFFALWPDDATREEVRLATRKLLRHCGGRPVPPRNFHVTLAFLGAVPAERLEAVTGCAGRIRFAPLELLLERVGWFAAAGALWLGPAVAPAPLPALAVELRLALLAAGLPPDSKPFMPHLTLARKVHAEPAVTSIPAVRWPVAEFVLVESVTDPDGAEYRILHRFSGCFAHCTRGGTVE